MSAALDLMKLPHGGQIGALKMSIVVWAAELPTNTPSSRIRRATASAGGGGGTGAGPDFDSHGRTTPRTTPRSSTVMVAVIATHSQGLRLVRGGWPQGGDAAAFVQTGGPLQAVGCSPGAPEAAGWAAADGTGQELSGCGAGPGVPGAKPPAG